MILNLTQHGATAEQAEAGVVEPQSKGVVQSLLTFNTLPTVTEITERAKKLAILARAEGATAVMIGGAPFLMGALQDTLMEFDITPLFAFSVRESVETENADGSVSKTAVFRHLGFVKVF